MAEQPKQVEIPKGNVCFTSYGVIQLPTVAAVVQTAQAIRDMTFQFTSGLLVDKARNDSVVEFLKDKHNSWLLFIDGDMVWAPDAVAQLLMTAYQTEPTADIVGGYCCLRGGRRLPTIDTGTGTWETHGPGKGAVDVMRTGAAALLVKRHVFERMPYPWFGIRNIPSNQVQSVLEIDNICHQIFDNRNPFAEAAPAEWSTLMQKVQHDAINQNQINQQQLFGTVGEDSNFCDKAKAMGFRIVVQTNAVFTHLETSAVGPKEHFDKMVEFDKSQKAASCVLA